MTQPYDKYLETVLLNRDRLDEAMAFINEVFSETDYNIAERVTLDDIEFTYHFLTNKHYVEKNEEETIIIKNHRRLTEIIFDFYYPKATGSKFYHYTKLSALNGILKKELKLKPLIKNINHNEFKTFYKDHNLIGYSTNTDESGKLMEQVLMEQCFAICFASPNGLTTEKDKTLWCSFADNGGGIRIEFDIKSNHLDFRQIFYHKKGYDKSKLLLNRLNKDTQEKFNRIFTIAGLSKIGAFYLPGFYNIENEVRFLMKKFTDDYKFHFDDSKGFIMLPFQSDYADISITKIRVGKTCSMDAVKKILKDNGYDNFGLLEVNE